MLAERNAASFEFSYIDDMLLRPIKLTDVAYYVNLLKMAKPAKSKSSFAVRLRKLRSILGFTQRQLADEFRVTPGAVALWESGARNLSGPVTKLLELYEQQLSSGPNDRRLGEA